MENSTGEIIKYEKRSNKWFSEINNDSIKEPLSLDFKKYDAPSEHSNYWTEKQGKWMDKTTSTITTDHCPIYNYHIKSISDHNNNNKSAQTLYPGEKNYKHYAEHILEITGEIKIDANNDIHIEIDKEKSSFINSDNKRITFDKRIDDTLTDNLKKFLEIHLSLIHI
jgi:hypothetical protein